MKVLVTGGAGYIGSHTCKALHTAGHIPVVFDNLSTGHAEFVRFGELVRGDIRDAAAIGTAMSDHRPDAVIHFAASAYVGESMREPRRYFQNNVTGTLTLLDAMAEHGVSRLVFSSSCATYGIPDTMPIRENTPQSPINPYGETKLIGEKMMRAMAVAEKLDCIALRYFNASGADPDGELGELHDPETHVIPLILASANGPAHRFAIAGDDYDTPDGTCIRDYLHVTDLASAHVAALGQLGDVSRFRAYNLGTGRGHSVKELIAAAERITGQSLCTSVAERRAGDPPVLVADADAARTELGWTPRYSDMDTILTSAWSWMRRPEHDPEALGRTPAIPR